MATLTEAFCRIFHNFYLLVTGEAMKILRISGENLLR